MKDIDKEAEIEFVESSRKMTEMMIEFEENNLPKLKEILEYNKKYLDLWTQKVQSDEFNEQYIKYETAVRTITQSCQAKIDDCKNTIILLKKCLDIYNAADTARKARDLLTLSTEATPKDPNKIN